MVAADGRISVVSAWNHQLGAGDRNTKGYAMSMFRLEQFDPACTGDGGGHGYDGRDAPMGTDAFEVFGGVLHTRGAVAYVNAFNSPLALTFAGLDPDGQYRGSDPHLTS